MGAWSTRIFDDDGAADIRGEYRILLGYNIEPDVAWQLIYDYFYPDYEGKDNEDIFWFSTALFQWQNGILREDVKQKALEAIESGSESERWKDSDKSVYKKRKEVLDKLKDKLLHEVNPTKKMRKCPAYYREKTKFQLGDIYAYAHENGKYSYIQVVKIGKRPVTDLYPELDYMSWSYFALLDLLTDNLLGIEELINLKYRKFYITAHAQDKLVDLITFHNEKETKEIWLYLGNRDLFEAKKEWYGSYPIYPIIKGIRNEYEAECIGPTFSLLHDISDEMLNDALTEWLKDTSAETLEERLRNNHPEWAVSVCHALSNVIIEAVQRYAIDFHTDFIYEHNPWKEENIYDNIPWISKENVQRLLGQMKEKEETGELKQWLDYLILNMK